MSAIWLADQGQGEKALECYALAAAQPLFASSAWFHQVFGKSIATRTAGLPADLAAAAQERGRQRPLWQTIEEFYAILKPAG